MAQNPAGGPFSQYLTAPLQPSAPEPTGFEGGGANVAFIASKFLDGIKQHRAQQFALQQLEEEKAQRGYETAIQAIQNNQNLTPAKRQELMTPLIQGLIGQAASVKEGAKHTGNPLTDLAKNIFTNATGGTLPKGQKLDMGLVGNVFSEMNNPENHVATHLTRGDQQAQQLISSMGQDATQEKILNSPDFHNVVNQTRAATGQADWMPDISHLPANDVELYKRKATVQGYNNYLPGITGNSGSASTQPTPGQPATGNVFKDLTLPQIRQINAKHADEQAFLKGQGIPPLPGQSMAPYNIDTTELDYLDPSGQAGKNIFRGVTVQGGNESGVYNLETGNRIQGARKALASDINALTPEEVAHAKATAESFKQNIKVLFKDNPVAADSFFKMLDEASLDSKDPGGKMNAILQRAESQASDAWQKKIAQSNAASQRAIANAAKSNNDVQEIAKWYNSAEPVQQATMARAQVSSVKAAMANAAANKNYGDADRLLIRAIAKLSDPATGVRDAEYTTFAQAAGSVQAGITKLNALFEQNGNILPEATRQQLLGDLDGLMKSLETNKIEYQNQAIRLAQDSGVGDRVARVIGTPMTTPPPPGNGAAPAPAAAPKNPRVPSKDKVKRIPG